MLFEGGVEDWQACCGVEREAGDGRGFAIATAMGDFGVDKKFQVRKRQGPARGAGVVFAAGRGMWNPAAIRAFRGLISALLLLNPSKNVEKEASNSHDNVLRQEEYRALGEARETTRPGDSRPRKTTACARSPTIAAGWQALHIDGHVIARPASRRPRRTAAWNMSLDRRTRHHRLFGCSSTILCRRGPRPRSPCAPRRLPSRMATPTPWRGCA